MERVLSHLLSGDPTPAAIADEAAWFSRHAAHAERFELPVDRALAGGFDADRLGFAFASGYTEALRRLVPDLPHRPTAMLATEKGSSRPRDLKTALTPDGDGWRMSGLKSFATLGRIAGQLVVFAVEGVDEAGRNRLAAVSIPADRDGITMRGGAAIPFAPEIGHCSTLFEDVRVEPDERLPGDGYDRYLKPFRTVEDCHVWAAALGWWIQVARRSGWPAPVIDELAAAAVTARALALADPTSPAVHVALSGLMAQTRSLLERAEPHWALIDDEIRARWERDRPLLQVAGQVRAARLEVARKRLAE